MFITDIVNSEFIDCPEAQKNKCPKKERALKETLFYRI